MERRSVQDAFDKIRPDAETRKRMLQNILLSSEIGPTGKDERFMRRRMKPMVIAAIVGVMIVMMGCAVAALRLADMQIAEVKTGSGQVLDKDGNVLKEEDFTMDIISLHGYKDSPAYLAHQEWFEFYEEYEDSHIITEEENAAVPPEEYEAYPAYNEELRDKIDEISGKYGMKLLGAFAPFQSSERKTFYAATGLESLLIPGSTAIIERESGYFYEGGNFKVEFHLTMPDSDGNWPYRMINSIYYSKSDYFDTVYLTLKDWEDWDQWTYTTSSGAELLIARAKSGYGAEIFCSREDAIITVGIDGYHEEENGNVTFMTKHQLEQVAEQFDYALKVEAVNMDLAREKLEKFANPKVSELVSTENTEWKDPYGYLSCVEALLAAENSEELRYVLSDLDGDCRYELLVGDQEQICDVWRAENGIIHVSLTEAVMESLNARWPDMEKKPLEVYYSE